VDALIPPESVRSDLDRPGGNFMPKLHRLPSGRRLSGFKWDRTGSELQLERDCLDLCRDSGAEWRPRQSPLERVLCLGSVQGRWALYRFGGSEAATGVDLERQRLVDRVAAGSRGGQRGRSAGRLVHQYQPVHGGWFLRNRKNDPCGRDGVGWNQLDGLRPSSRANGIYRERPHGGELREHQFLLGGWNLYGLRWDSLSEHSLERRICVGRDHAPEPGGIPLDEALRCELQRCVRMCGGGRVRRRGRSSSGHGAQRCDQRLVSESALRTGAYRRMELAIRRLHGRLGLYGDR
jgi:hypothetical protein